MMHKELEAAYTKIRHAELDLEDLARRLMPEGTVIGYIHGSHMVYARIIKVRRRAEVESVTSGKKYWIGIYRIDRILDGG